MPRRARAALIVAVSFGAGSVPFSQIAAGLARGTDLRRFGSGTVSGTALYEVAGFGPLAVAGVLDVAKGAVGPLLARREPPAVQAAAAAAAVAGHNWSPFLGGAGGRGISPALGALLVTGPAGAAVLLGGLTVGRMVRHTALASLVADVLLVPALAAVHGRDAARTGAALLAPMIAKRLAGNHPAPASDRWRVYRNRLLFDRDGASA